MKVYELINRLLEMPAGADVQMGGDIDNSDLPEKEFNILAPVEQCYLEDDNCVLEW